MTVLLRKWGSGDEGALDELIPIVYGHLREIGASVLRAERPGHILQPTALVNEAYLRLAAGGGTVLQNRSHFFAVASRVMRKILVDYAHRRRRKKRGGEWHFVSIETELLEVREDPDQMLVFDEALTRLAKEHPRKSRIVELHSFAGVTLTEAAALLGIAENTAQRDWKFAKAWMLRELGRHDERRG